MCRQQKKNIYIYQNCQFWRSDKRRQTTHSPEIPGSNSPPGEVNASFSNTI